MSNGAPEKPDDEANLTSEDIKNVGGDAVKKVESKAPPEAETVDRGREKVRAQLARGLLLILAATLAAVFIFIGFGQLDGIVLTQSIFPSLIGLAGTALGFYFGAETRSSG